MNTKMLSLYVTNLLCEDESEHEGVWPFQGEGIANDAIRLSTMITVKRGIQEPIQEQLPVLNLGNNYQDGTNVALNQQIYSIPLNSLEDYPIAVSAVMVLGEEDWGGNFDAQVRNTITEIAQQAKSAVSAAVTTAAGGLIGASFGSFGGPIGIGIGAAAGALISLLAEGVNSLESDVWPPEDIALVVTADAKSTVHSGQILFRDKPNFRNLGGQYRLTYEWRLEGSEASIEANWQLVPGKLKQVSANANGEVWGVNANDDIFQWNGSAWALIPGHLKHVSIGSDGTVWGVNEFDEIFKRIGDGWALIPGGLKQISVGNANHIWGVNFQDDIFTLDTSSLGI